jgi:hypothetical protein
MNLTQLLPQPTDDSREGLRRLAHVAAGEDLIMLALLGFNAMGDAIRHILDLRMLNRVRRGRTT